MKFAITLIPDCAVNINAGLSCLYKKKCVDFDFFEKMENAATVMAANFKSKTHLQKAIFILELFRHHLAAKLEYNASKSVNKVFVKISRRV
jgi:hypothetical protein